MKTHNNLYPSTYNFKNLYNAYLSAREGKRYRKDVLKFSANLEEELICLQNNLIWKSYTPSPYKEFYVNDPKKRLIMAPAFCDRVLHHAICNVVMPLFDQKFIFDSYACRIGKGTHRGADRLTWFLRKALRQWPKVYCLKCDIRSYFSSIPHVNLKMAIRKTIRCKDTLWLIDTIIDSLPDGVGIPLGNLTSQLFANVYLDDMDHFIKEVLRVKYFIRYMDDFVLLLEDKRTLAYYMAEISSFLSPKGLALNEKTSIFPISHGIDFLGYRVWPTHRLLRKSSIRRAKRKFKAFSRRYKRGIVSRDKIKESLNSWLAHAGYCNSYNARKIILADLSLSKQTLF